jgi:hypothetical protein
MTRLFTRFGSRWVLVASLTCWSAAFLLGFTSPDVSTSKTPATQKVGHEDKNASLQADIHPRILCVLRRVEPLNPRAGGAARERAVERLGGSQL